MNKSISKTTGLMRANKTIKNTTNGKSVIKLTVRNGSKIKIKGATRVHG
jgi:hypothetical protein